MRTNSSTLSLALGGMIALAVAAGPAWAFAAQCSSMGGHSEKAPAKETAMGHSHEMAELHGGSVTMTPIHHFEVLCTQKEARLYVYDDRQAPITDLEGMNASMALQEKAGKSVTMPMTYVKPDSTHGRSQGYFTVAHDFSDAEKGALKANFHVEGLGKEPVEFKSALAAGEPTMYACPMHADVTGEDPGKCGKCGMNFEKMGGSEEGEHGHEAGGSSDHNHR